MQQAEQFQREATSAQKIIALAFAIILIVGVVAYLFGLERGLDALLIGGLVWWWVWGKKRAAKTIAVATAATPAERAREQRLVARSLIGKRSKIVSSVAFGLMVVAVFLGMPTWAVVIVTFAGLMVTAFVLHRIDSRNEQ